MCHSPLICVLFLSDFVFSLFRFSKILLQYLDALKLWLVQHTSVFVLSVRFSSWWAVLNRVVNSSLVFRCCLSTRAQKHDYSYLSKTFLSTLLLTFPITHNSNIRMSIQIDGPAATKPFLAMILTRVGQPLISPRDWVCRPLT